MWYVLPLVVPAAAGGGFDPATGFPWQGAEALPDLTVVYFDPQGQAWAIQPPAAAPAFDPASGFPWTTADALPDLTVAWTDNQHGALGLVPPASPFDPSAGFPWATDPLLPALTVTWYDGIDGALGLVPPAALAFDPSTGFPWTTTPAELPPPLQWDDTAQAWTIQSAPQLTPNPAFDEAAPAVAWDDTSQTWAIMPPTAAAFDPSAGFPWQGADALPPQTQLPDLTQQSYPVQPVAAPGFDPATGFPWARNHEFWPVLPLAWDFLTQSWAVQPVTAVAPPTITMPRMHDIQYHAVIYNPDSQGGPGTPKLELDPDALNLVWQQALNYPAMAAIGMARFNEKLADIAYMQDHIKIFREDSKGLKTVFSGKAVKPDETARDSLVYFWDYTAFLQRSRTGFRVLYPDKFIDEIVSAEWTLAKAADKSPFEFVTTGTIERPLGLDGTTPIKVNSQFGVINFDRLFTFFALAELSMANTSNTVVFEITRESPHTFNFWKNRSQQRTSYHFTFPGNLIDYSLEDGHSEIVNDISTPILDPTTGAQVEYALTDTASKDTYRRLQAAVAIKTLFGINAGTTETDQQKAALARLLSISATVPSLYTLFPRQGEITPFDGWDLGDTIRTTILNPKKTGDATDSYKRITGIAGAWSPAGGELLQLSVR